MALWKVSPEFGCSAKVDASSEAASKIIAEAQLFLGVFVTEHLPAGEHEWLLRRRSRVGISSHQPHLRVRPHCDAGLDQGVSPALRNVCYDKRRALDQTDDFDLRMFTRKTFPPDATLYCWIAR